MVLLMNTQTLLIGPVNRPDFLHSCRCSFCALHSNVFTLFAFLTLSPPSFFSYTYLGSLQLSTIQYNLHKFKHFPPIIYSLSLILSLKSYDNLFSFDWKSILRGSCTHRARYQTEVNICIYIPKRATRIYNHWEEVGQTI